MASQTGTWNHRGKLVQEEKKNPFYEDRMEGRSKRKSNIGQKFPSVLLGSGRTEGGHCRSTGWAKQCQ